jgi:hypothetical protein
MNRFVVFASIQKDLAAGVLVSRDHLACRVIHPAAATYRTLAHRIITINSQCLYTLTYRVMFLYNEQMNKPTLVLKRHGQLAVARIDLVTERPVSVDELDGETPPGCVDKALPVAQAEATYGPYYALRYLERERGPEKVAENTVSDAEIQAILAARPEEAAPAPKPPITSIPQPLPQAGSSADVLVFRELELMFAKRQVASGKKKKELDTDIRAVCNFLIRVFPTTLPALQELSGRYQQEQKYEF